MKALSIIPKALGMLTAGLVVYDGHKNAVRTSHAQAKSSVADDMVDNYVNTLSVSKPSTVEVNAKKSWFKFCMDSTIVEKFNAVCGYVSGFVSSVVDDVIPTALAIGSFIPGKKVVDAAGKTTRKTPVAGLVCAAGLLLYGLNFMLFDVIGIGKRDYLNREN